MSGDAARFSVDISVLALFVALASFGLALYNSLRDRPRLKVESIFFEENAYQQEARIKVVLINTGRRPVILRMIGGEDLSGRWSGVYLGNDQAGIRLGEHERHELHVKKEDTVAFSQDDEDVFWVLMWVEDSLGIRHKIPNSSSHIKKLWS